MREGRRELRLNRQPGSDSNDIEDVSSQSFAGDSGDRLHKSFKGRRQSSSSSKKEREKDNDSDEYSFDSRYKKQIRNKKKPRSASRESVQDILSKEADIGKNDVTSDRKKNKKRRKSKKKNENHSHDSTGERDSSIKKDSDRSGKKNRHGRGKPNELPITQILKNAEEQRTKYEDPTPLPELTTNTIYVQGVHGFSAIKIGSNVKTSRRNSNILSKPSSIQLINVAITFQKFWRSIGFICQGLFGGLALLHFVFMQTYFNDSEEFVNNYSVLSEIYSSTFSFLITICIVTTFDKFDIAQFGFEYLREIFKHHLTSILAVPLYLAAFSIHQVTTKVEDKLTLLRYNCSNLTYHSFSNTNVTHGNIEFNELQAWQRMTLSKDALAVLGWVFISMANRKSMLLLYLDAMGSYAENPSI